MIARRHVAGVILSSFLLVGAAAIQGKVAPDRAEPCCQVTGITAGGVATAVETRTGRTFQFKVKDQALLTSLHVGQSVWADFATQAVALAAGAQPCCQMVGAAATSGKVAPDRAEPCCQVTGITAGGLVTAVETRTGRTFEFKVKDQTLLTSLHVGQSVWADFATQAVALAAGAEPCCNIVGPPAAGPAQMPTSQGANPCCQVVSNPALTGSLGRLVVAFPEGADVGSSRVDVFKAGEKTVLQGGFGAQAWDLMPGTYAVTISGARVEGVTVESGHDTRVRAGILRVRAGPNTRVDVIDGGTTTLTGGFGSLVVGLPVGTFHVRIAGQTQPVTIGEGKITDF